ncbi:Uncharacterized zinc protease [Seminavis robusta]|uniref:Uncharacterized zinc protease n=1 Tax=Seminavis robusta TaxID=568900 RepID=A0A9N8HGF1_9STRA|nr:Uncharacterized zinc protease [Seminavis robusta]|eukprot:Sro394_g133820.1 Uncharacterized zinc protease (1126) ;mRNA; r:27417-31101
MPGPNNQVLAAFLWLFFMAVEARRHPDFNPRRTANNMRSDNYAQAAARQQQMPETSSQEKDKSDSVDKIFAYPYEDYRLESNGLQVIIVPLGDDFPGIVSTHITITTGSRNELEPGKTGMAHFFEHCMFRGTSNISSEEFDATYAEMGASYNAWTWVDTTNYYATFPKAAADGTNNLEVIMLYESDRFKYLNYAEDDFKTEAGAILGEYNYYQDKIWNTLDEVRNNLSYAVHPYRHPVLGTLEDIKDMPNELEYSRVFFERFYKPENAILMVFGDVAVNETKELIEQYWGDWEQGEGYVSDIPQEPARESAVYEHIDWPEASTPWLSISFNAANFTVSEPDTAALDIIQFMVFSSASSLHSKLVIEEQVVIDLQAWYYWFKDPALFMIEANVANIDSLWYVRDEILKALAQLRTETVSNQALDRVKSNLKYGAAMGFISTDAIADDIQYYVSLTGNPDSINQLYALYDKVTPETLLAVANKYFTDDHLATISLSHAGDTLPEPPTPASADVNVMAGSVDAMVEVAMADDGFQIDQVTLPSESSQLVHFDIRFRVGASDDPKGKEGLAALATQMASYAGSSSMTYNQIQDLLFPMAASWESSTGKEYSYFSGTTHADNVDRYYDIISEMLLDPGFREDDFERIKTETIRSIEDEVYSDSSVGLRAFDGTIFESHPYEHNKHGNISSLENISLDDVKEFYSSWFTKSNLILGLAGGFSDQFVKKVHSDLQKLPEGSPPDKSFLEPPPARIASNAIIIQQEATQATTVTFGFSLPAGMMSRAHPDFPALVIALNHYGSGGFSSKLMSEIRVKRGINYGNNARLRYGGLAFQVNLGAMDTTEIAHFTTRLAMFELNKLISQGLTQLEYEFVRNSIVNVLPVAVDTPSKVLSLAMEGLEYGFGSDYLEFMLPALRNTSLVEVNAVAKKWLQDEAVSFVFVTPDAAEMHSRLINETESTISYDAEDVPVEVMFDDEVIKDYPLGLVPENVAIVSASDLFGTTVGGIQAGSEAVVLEDANQVLGLNEGASTNSEEKEDSGEEEVATESSSSYNAENGNDNDSDNPNPSNDNDNAEVESTVANEGDDIDTMDIEVTDDSQIVADSAVQASGCRGLALAVIGYAAALLAGLFMV